MISRSYKDWMQAVANKKRDCPDLDLVIRHDIDYDIETARAMMEIEREHGLNSVVYVDVHSPSYSINDIIALSKDYSPHGFRFGVHINVAYDNTGEDACWSAYLDDLKLLRDQGIEPHSCVAHFYDERLVPNPEYDNLAVELKSTAQHEKEDVPLGFFPACFKRPIFKIGDGGGLISNGVESFIDSLPENASAYLSFHPVHYRQNGDGKIIYGKRLGTSKTMTEKDIHAAQDAITPKLPPYFQTRLGQSFQLSYALRVLNDILNRGYRKLFTIVDAGCGFGLLGAYLMHRNNVKYIGFDLEAQFIAAGKEFFDLLGYAPNLQVGDLYKDNIKGNILVFLGYEDCDVDYDRILEACKEYEFVVMTIMGKDKFKLAKQLGKDYAFIEQEAFEEKFGQFFHIGLRVKRGVGRILYLLKRNERK